MSESENCSFFFLRVAEDLCLLPDSDLLFSFPVSDAATLASDIIDSTSNFLSVTKSSRAH